jgi:hypothetical protein
LIELQLRESQKRLPSLQFKEQPSTFDISLYWTLHVLDVWTTNRALKCDRVFEANLLLPKKPHFDRLLIHKLLFLAPSYGVWRTGAFDKHDIEFANWLMTMVVVNNSEIVYDVTENC